MVPLSDGEMEAHGDGMYELKVNTGAGERCVESGVFRLQGQVFVCSRPSSMLPPERERWEGRGGVGGERRLPWRREGVIRPEGEN